MEPSTDSKSVLRCDWCSEEFEKYTYRITDGNNFCSAECRKAHSQSDNIYVECSNCGERIKIPPSRGEGEYGEYHLENHFCDKKCESEWKSENWGGESHPNYNGGKVKVSCEWCGDAYTVTPALEDTTRFCSRECHGAHLGSTKDNSGRNNPAWQGGESGIHAVRRFLSDKSWFKIRHSVLSKNGWVCEMCGATKEDGQIHLHHIIPVASGGTNGEWNLLPVCPSCHRKAEEYIKEYTRPELYKYAEGDT